MNKYSVYVTAKGINTGCIVKLMKHATGGDQKEQIVDKDGGTAQFEVEEDIYDVNAQWGNEDKWEREVNVNETKWITFNF